MTPSPRPSRRLKWPDYLKTNTAPKLAVYLLKMQGYQYQNAAGDTAEQKPAKDALLKEVYQDRQRDLKLWAAKEEGDAARIVLMQLALAQENVKEADRILSEINPLSTEYPNALSAMGYAHWNNVPQCQKTDRSRQGGR